MSTQPLKISLNRRVVVKVAVVLALAGIAWLGYEFLWGEYDEPMAASTSLDGRHRCETGQHWFNGGAQVEAVVTLSGGGDGRWRKQRQEWYYLDSAGYERSTIEWNPDRKPVVRVAYWVGNEKAPRMTVKWPIN